MVCTVANFWDTRMKASTGGRGSVCSAGWSHAGSGIAAGMGTGQKRGSRPCSVLVPSVSPSHDTHDRRARGARGARSSVHIPADEGAALGVSSHGTVQVLLGTAPGLGQHDHECHRHCQHSQGQQHQAADLPRAHGCSCAVGAAGRSSVLSRRRLPCPGEVDISRQFCEGGPTAVGSAPSDYILSNIKKLLKSQGCIFSFLLS